MNCLEVLQILNDNQTYVFGDSITVTVGDAIIQVVYKPNGMCNQDDSIYVNGRYLCNLNYGFMELMFKVRKIIREANEINKASKFSIN